MKIVLLVTLVSILVAGPLIYRPSPLQGPTFIFNLIEAAPLVDIGHTLHLQLLALHRYASYVLAALLLLHIALAFRLPAPGAPTPMAWLWRGQRREPHR